jgi:hypothetical protein
MLNVLLLTKYHQLLQEDNTKQEKKTLDFMKLKALQYHCDCFTTIYFLVNDSYFNH